MKITSIVARILLGLLFTFAGAMGFLMIANPPPQQPGLVGEFTTVFFASKWILFVKGVELLAGILLLTNRFVPLALTLLGGVLYNILAVHITMMPAGLPVPCVALALWFLASLPYRASFAFLAKAKYVPVTTDRSERDLQIVRDIPFSLSRESNRSESLLSA